MRARILIRFLINAAEKRDESERSGDRLAISKEQNINNVLI